jgi:hypothetical protein
LFVPAETAAEVAGLAPLRRVGIDEISYRKSPLPEATVLRRSRRLIEHPELVG